MFVLRSWKNVPIGPIYTHQLARLGYDIWDRVLLSLLWPPWSPHPSVPENESCVTFVWYEVPDVSVTELSKWKDIQRAGLRWPKMFGTDNILQNRYCTLWETEPIFIHFVFTRFRATIKPKLNSKQEEGPAFAAQTGVSWSCVVIPFTSKVFLYCHIFQNIFRMQGSHRGTSPPINTVSHIQYLTSVSEYIL